MAKKDKARKPAAPAQPKLGPGQIQLPKTPVNMAIINLRTTTEQRRKSMQTGEAVREADLVIEALSQILQASAKGGG